MNSKAVGIDVSQILPDVSDDARDLFCRLMDLDFDRRISAKDALKHKFFN